MIEQVANTLQLPQPPESGVASRGKTKVWCYLLASSVTFSKEVEYGIRIQKPCDSILGLWLQRLIVSRQCATIYVENLSLSKTEKHSILQLCDGYDVELVNLIVDSSSQGNVVIGPW